MLIRSQDKRTLVAMDRIFSINIYESDREFIVDATDNIGSETIATYSTEENALKVFDMICDKYQETHNTASKSAWSAEFIFNMPKDEDVVTTDENGVIVDGTRSTDIC